MATKFRMVKKSADTLWVRLQGTPVINAYIEGCFLSCGYALRHVQFETTTRTNMICGYVQFTDRTGPVRQTGQPGLD